MAQIVQHKYNPETRGFDTFIDKYRLKYIVLKCLYLDNSFTLTDIKIAWNKKDHKVGCWFPGKAIIEPVLDELLGEYLSKKYISIKLTHGSVTESLYTRLK